MLSSLNESYFLKEKSRKPTPYLSISNSLHHKVPTSSQLQRFSHDFQSSLSL